jgi:hypothetical protein
VCGLTLSSRGGGSGQSRVVLNASGLWRMCGCPCRVVSIIGCVVSRLKVRRIWWPAVYSRGLVFMVCRPPVVVVVSGSIAGGWITVS